MRPMNVRHAAPLLALSACFAPTPQSAPCTSDSDCNLRGGGTCLPSPVGMACAYPNAACAGGLAWGELTPELNQACVDETPIDARDASVDATDGPVGACTGPRLAFVDGMSNADDVYISTSTGAQRLALSPGPGGDYAAVGSAVGTVAFSSTRTGNLDVYLINADGTNLRNLTDRAGNDLVLDITSNGMHVAYIRTNGALHVVDSDGANDHAVAAANVAQARWSPDGARLAFQLMSGGEADIWTVNRDGTGLRQITSIAGYEALGDWSRDGTRLVYTADDDVHIINADGTGDVNLTADAAAQYGPRWSPTADVIAFSEGGNIRSMPASGGTRTTLTSGPDNDILPKWSHDGAMVAFQRVDQANTRQDAATVAADGSGLTTIAGPANYTTSSSWVFCP